jgi:hypothetical protein
MNKQLFDLYRSSERGKSVIELFKVEETTDVVTAIDKLISKAREWTCDIPKANHWQRGCGFTGA